MMPATRKPISTTAEELEDFDVAGTAAAGGNVAACGGDGATGSATRAAAAAAGAGAGVGFVMTTVGPTAVAGAR
jgi:hypothetical protein